MAYFRPSAFVCPSRPPGTLSRFPQNFGIQLEKHVTPWNRRWLKGLPKRNLVYMRQRKYTLVRICIFTPRYHVRYPAAICYQVQAGSSIKPKISSDADVHAVFEIYTSPEILHTCLMCPCRASNDFFFVPPSDICVVVFLYLRLKRPHIFGEKKKKNIRKRLGKGTLNTCKFSGSNSQKRRGHLDLRAVKCKNHGLAS